MKINDASQGTFIKELLYGLAPIAVVSVVLFLLRSIISISNNSIYLGMAFVIGIYTASLGSYYRYGRDSSGKIIGKEAKELRKDIVFIIIYQILATVIIDILFFKH